MKRTQTAENKVTQAVNKQAVKKKVTGAEAVILCLLEENIDTIFGYPGGAIMPVYDSLFFYQNKIRPGAIQARRDVFRIMYHENPESPQSEILMDADAVIGVGIDHQDGRSTSHELGFIELSGIQAEKGR